MPYWLGLIFGQLYHQLGDDLRHAGYLLSYLEKNSDSPLCNFAVAKMLYVFSIAPQIAIKFAEKSSGILNHYLHDFSFTFSSIELISELPSTVENRKRKQVKVNQYFETPNSMLFRI